ncbi:5-dehydro-2-deoxygluconokinase [Anoxynatronum buryatiense]|uniref:5-dehydro-2-deoxygluconokinase n=1 Tax=Anoxynatronum buryatiense TaxID=489973 RepID=A0AA45WSM3_9CLOT|nr:5-dehydro-2-deoxygluconokinase [Anoxynatronum buryatiense]SMP38560.1 5-dehydro-2-deoxygluconokinase [Anoxynatronum buryatiense]
MILNQQRPLDLILAGRAGIDFNAGQMNSSFAETATFFKTVGGSPANIAQGTARLGLKTGFVGKVAGDGMGTYIRKVFEKAGIDITGLMDDQTGARNCLAVTEILNPHQSGSYLYREKTADLMIQPDEISEAYVKRASAVLISGTALSESPSREAMLTLITYARRQKTHLLMDLDYRPFGWKSAEEAALYYSMTAELCDVVIGNREEFDVLEFLSMPGNRDNQRTAQDLLSKGVQLVVIKDGARGSCAYTADGKIVKQGIIPTRIKKTFGSGDAYAAGLLYGLFSKWPLAEAMALGSACASIVLAGDSCADAMPTLEEAKSHLADHQFISDEQLMEDLT